MTIVNFLIEVTNEKEALGMTINNRKKSNLKALINTAFFFLYS
ncbi:hypothetical protein V1503_03080 [Bacillus sp. SCS-151]